MYTVQMLVDQLNGSLCTNRTIVPKDYITTVRIMTGGSLQDRVLYLKPHENGSTFCQSAAGSSFLFHDSLAHTLNRLLEICDYYSAWEKDLEKACRTGCTLAELLDLAYPLITHPLIILDNNEWMIACSSVLSSMPLDDNQDLTDLLRFRSSSVDKIAEFNLRFSDCFQRKDVYLIPGDIFTASNAYAMNLFHNDHFSGILMMEGFETPITQGKLDLFYLFGLQIRKMLNDPSSGLSIGMEEASFLRFMKDPSPGNLEELERDLEIRSWDRSDEKQIIYITPIAGRSLSPNLNHAFLMFNRLFGLNAAEYREGILLLVNLRILKERSAYASLMERIRQLAYCAGISNTFTDISKLSIMAQRAYAALHAGDQSAGAVNYFTDRYMYFFFSLIDDSDRELLIHPLTEELKKYDQRYGSRLYETLFHYLNNERGITRTAREMHLSRSTLLHRIERIESLAGDQLEDPEIRMRILLSYYLEYTSGNKGANHEKLE